MNYQQKIHKLTSLLLIAAITLTAVSSASCQKMTTTTMQLMKTEGTVGIADGKGKTIEPAYTVTNPETGRGKPAYISGWEMAQLTAYSEDKDGEISIQDFTPGDIPEYILEEVLEDDALLEKILADSDMDLQNREEGGEAECLDISVEAGEGWREAYQPLIAQANSWDFGEEHGEWLDRLGTIPNIPPFSAYYLHDINGDGIPELIVSVSNDLEVLFAYYTYRECEGALYIGEDWRSVRAGLYKESSGQMVIVEFERYEDVGKLYQVTLPGDQILIQPSGEARSGEIEAAGRDELDWSYGDDLSLLQNYDPLTP